MGGTGNDEITSSGTLDATSYAQAGATEVGVTVPGVTIGLPVGATLADTSTNALAASTGIDGGAGADNVTVEGSGTVVAGSLATADTTTVLVNLDFLGLAWIDVATDATPTSLVIRPPSHTLTGTSETLLTTSSPRCSV